jgi:hypothetical protein
MTNKHARHRQSREIDVTHVLREKRRAVSSLKKKAGVIGAVRRLPCLCLWDKDGRGKRHPDRRKCHSHDVLAFIYVVERGSVHNPDRVRHLLPSNGSASAATGRLIGYLMTETHNVMFAPHKGLECR